MCTKRGKSLQVLREALRGLYSLLCFVNLENKVSITVGGIYNKLWQLNGICFSPCEPVFILPFCMYTSESLTDVVNIIRMNMNFVVVPSFGVGCNRFCPNTRFMPCAPVMSGSVLVPSVFPHLTTPSHILSLTLSVCLRKPYSHGCPFS